MTRQIPPLALGALALMALLLAALWLAPGVPAGWRQWQAPPPQAPNLDDLTAAALRFNPAAVAVYPVVLQRPLLSAARRPQAPASASAAGPAAPPPTAIEQVRMQGIVAGPTLTGVFLEEDGQSRFVRRGEQVGDWTLDAVRGRDIVFKRGAEQRTIELLPTPADPAQGAGKNAGQPAPAAARRGAGAATPPPARPTAPPPARPATPPAPPPAATPLAIPTPAPAPAAGQGSSSRGGFGGGQPRAAPDTAPR